MFGFYLSFKPPVGKNFTGVYLTGGIDRVYRPHTGYKFKFNSLLWVSGVEFSRSI